MCEFQLTLVSVAFKKRVTDHNSQAVGYTFFLNVLNSQHAVDAILSYLKTTLLVCLSVIEVSVHVWYHDFRAFEDKLENGICFQHYLILYDSNSFLLKLSVLEVCTLTGESKFEVFYIK